MLALLLTITLLISQSTSLLSSTKPVETPHESTLSSKTVLFDHTLFDDIPASLTIPAQERVAAFAADIKPRCVRMKDAVTLITVRANLHHLWELLDRFFRCTITSLVSHLPREITDEECSLYQGVIRSGSRLSRFKPFPVSDLTSSNGLVCYLRHKELFMGEADPTEAEPIIKELQESDDPIVQALGLFLKKKVDEALSFNRVLESMKELFAAAKDMPSTLCWNELMKRFEDSPFRATVCQLLPLIRYFTRSYIRFVESGNYNEKALTADSIRKARQEAVEWAETLLGEFRRIAPFFQCFYTTLYDVCRKQIAYERARGGGTIEVENTTEGLKHHGLTGCRQLEDLIILKLTREELFGFPAAPAPLLESSRNPKLLPVAGGAGSTVIEALLAAEPSATPQRAQRTPHPHAFRLTPDLARSASPERFDIDEPEAPFATLGPSLVSLSDLVGTEEEFRLLAVAKFPAPGIELPRDLPRCARHGVCVQPDADKIDWTLVASAPHKALGAAYEQPAPELPFNTRDYSEPSVFKNFIEIAHRRSGVQLRLINFIPLGERKKTKVFAGFEYHERVKLWFTDAPKALEKDYLTPGGRYFVPKELQAKVIPYKEFVHTFCPLFDQFMFDYGKVTLNPDGAPGQWNLHLPIEVRFGPHKAALALLTYNFYKEGGKWICNHRCLTYKPRDPFIGEYFRNQWKAVLES